MLLNHNNLEEDLCDLVLCTICIELLEDTRVLSCGHTFCLKCLQRYGVKKRPGDKIPCPMCRTDFEVPNGGFSGLPRNFLLEKILELHAFSMEEMDFVELMEKNEQKSEDKYGKSRKNSFSESGTEQQQQQQKQQRQLMISSYSQTDAAENGNQSSPQQVPQQLRTRQLEQRQQQRVQNQQQQQQSSTTHEQRQQEHQQRQQQQQLKRQRQLDMRRWQLYQQRRRSSLGIGCWSKRILLISLVLNFFLIGSLWYSTELMKEETRSWSTKANDYETKINEMNEEDLKNKNVIDSNEINCQRRVFASVQQCQMDLEFHKAFLQTMTKLLETYTHPQEPTFSVL